MMMRWRPWRRVGVRLHDVLFAEGEVVRRVDGSRGDGGGTYAAICHTVGG